MHEKLLTSESSNGIQIMQNYCDSSILSSRKNLKIMRIDSSLIVNNWRGKYFDRFLIILTVKRKGSKNSLKIRTKFERNEENDFGS